MNKSHTTVLFTSAGRRVSLARQFKAAQASIGDHGRVLTADVSTTAPALYAGDGRFLVPNCGDPAFVPSLVEICEQESVRLLVPLIDTELPVLAAHRDVFRDIGTIAYVSDPDTIAVCQDKSASAGFFREIGLSTPNILTPEEADGLTAADFPVFVKPATGSSSIGAQKVRSIEELRFYQTQWPDLIVQEFIDGDEFTVDVYVDLNGTAQCAVPRQRLAVRAGEVSKARSVKDLTIMRLAKDVAAKLPGARGCITIQCIRTTAKMISFIEVNPRFGGGFPLSVHAGANFPLWALQELNEIAPDYGDGVGWQDNLCMLRYDDEILVDGAIL